MVKSSVAFMPGDIRFRRTKSGKKFKKQKAVMTAWYEDWRCYY